MWVKFTVLLMILPCQTTVAQEWEWAKVYNAGGNDIVTSLGGTDKDGSIYYITNTKLYYNSPNAPPPWNFCKADPQGNILWKKTEVGGVCKTDNDKFIYVASGSTLLKYDTDGKVIWSLTEPYTYFEKIFINQDRLVLSGFKKKDSVVSVLQSYDLEGNPLWVRIAKYGIFNCPITSKNKSIIVYSKDVYEIIPPINNKLFHFDNDGNLLNASPVPFQPKSIASDLINNSYVIGVYDDKYYININGKDIFGKVTTSSSTYFLIKYNSAGELLWYKLFSGNFGNMELHTDAQGTPYFIFETTSIKYDHLDISPNALTVFRLDENNGNILWYKTSEGEIYGERAGNTVQARAAFSSEGDLIFAGGFKNGFKFGNSSLKCDDYCDIFLAKLSLKDVTTVIPQHSEDDPFVTVFPNPSGTSFTITAGDCRLISYTLSDGLGRQISLAAIADRDQRTFAIDISSYSKGIYFLTVQTEQGTKVKKLIRN